MPVVEQPFNLSLQDCADRLWALTRGAEGREGLWLADPMNLASKLKFTLRSTTEQIGQSIAGWHVDELETSMSLALLSTRDTSVWTGWQMCVSGFTPLGVGSLIAGSDNLGKVHLPVRFTGYSDPAKSPATPGIQRVDFDVHVLATSGCWFGVEQRKTVQGQTTVTIKNDGDFPLWPEVEWTGTGAVVEVTGGGRIALPDSRGKTAVLSTDPATAGRVTVQGVVDTQLWRGIRGQYISTPVPPKGVAEWKFTNCTAIITERYSTMWGGGI